MKEIKLTSNINSRLKKGESIFGIIHTLSSSAVSELLALNRFDYIMLDMEHGPITFESLVHCMRAVYMGGSIPFVRVPANDAKQILRALDAGIQGVMVPQVNTPDEALFCAKAVRYAPVGNRGLSINTVVSRFGNRPVGELIDESNKSVTLIAQLETVTAYENLDGILEVPGIDAFLIGHADLSQSMGFPGQTRHPEVQKVAGEIITKCVAKRKPVGVVTVDIEEAKMFQKMGCQIILTCFTTLVNKVMAEFVQSTTTG